MKRIFFILATFCFAVPAYASIIAESTFDTSLGGWTSNTPAEISWASSGGNPGPYVRFGDLTSSNSIILAPFEFLGDWSALESVGILFYDHRIFSIGTGATGFPYGVTIQGPGGQARWLGVIPTGTTPWIHIDVPIIQAEWNILSGTWTGLLANVASLQIRIEQISNLSSIGDVTGVDNIRLRTLAAVPEPSTSATFGLALTGMLFSLGVEIVSEKSGKEKNRGQSLRYPHERQSEISGFAKVSRILGHRQPINASRPYACA